MGVEVILVTTGSPRESKLLFTKSHGVPGAFMVLGLRFGEAITVLSQAEDTVVGNLAALEQGPTVVRHESAFGSRKETATAGHSTSQPKSLAEACQSAKTLPT